MFPPEQVPSISKSMARKHVCCKLTSLEVVLVVLFLLMTGIAVGLMTILALHMNSTEHSELRYIFNKLLQNIYSDFLLQIKCDDWIFKLKVCVIEWN